MGILGGWFKRYKYENTRQYLRLPAHWPLKCEPKAGQQESASLHRAKDVSAGGVRLVSGQMFPVGTYLRLEIHVPPLNRSICAEGQVVRCLPAARGGFELGVRFLQIDPKDGAALKDLAEQLLSPDQKAIQKREAWRKFA